MYRSYKSATFDGSLEYCYECGRQSNGNLPYFMTLFFLDRNIGFTNGGLVLSTFGVPLCQQHLAHLVIVAKKLLLNPDQMGTNFGCSIEEILMGPNDYHVKQPKLLNYDSAKSLLPRSTDLIFRDLLAPDDRYSADHRDLVEVRISSNGECTFDRADEQAYDLYRTIKRKIMRTRCSKKLIDLLFKIYRRFTGY